MIKPPKPGRRIKRDTRSMTEQVKEDMEKEIEAAQKGEVYLTDTDTRTEKVE